MAISPASKPKPGPRDKTARLRATTPPYLTLGHPGAAARSGIARFLHPGARRDPCGPRAPRDPRHRRPGQPAVSLTPAALQPGGVCQVPGIGDIGGLVGLCTRVRAGSSAT